MTNTDASILDTRVIELGALAVLSATELQVYLVLRSLAEIHRFEPAPAHSGPALVGRWLVLATQRQIAERVGRTRTTANKALARLEARGLVTVDTDDRYLKRALDEADPRQRAVVYCLGEQYAMQRREWAAFYLEDLVDRLWASIEKYHGPPESFALADRIGVMREALEP